MHFRRKRLTQAKPALPAQAGRPQSSRGGRAAASLRCDFVWFCCHVDARGGAAGSIGSGGTGDLGGIGAPGGAAGTA